MGIAFDTFGDPSAPTVLLIQGLATQMIAWRPAFCRALAARGFHVIRFDNRDIGLSERVRDGARPNPVASVLKRHLGVPLRPAYTLEDMAGDAFGLLDRLGRRRAHVVGASMGGMIGQVMAIRRPERVLSLTSMMSSTGARNLPGATLRALGSMLKPIPRDRPGYVAHQVEQLRALGSRRFFDRRAAEGYFAEVAERSMDRSGVPRQLAAVLDAPARDGLLGRYDGPARVIHGAEDPLLPPVHGWATAKALRAPIELVPGMGHDLPEALWRRYLNAIAGTARAAGDAHAGAAA